MFRRQDCLKDKLYQLKETNKKDKEQNDINDNCIFIELYRPCVLPNFLAWLICHVVSGSSSALSTFIFFTCTVKQTLKPQFLLAKFRKYWKNEAVQKIPHDTVLLPLDHTLLVGFLYLDIHIQAYLNEFFYARCLWSSLSNSLLGSNCTESATLLPIPHFVMFLKL